MNRFNNIEVILFDLGGVLIDFGGLSEIRRYLPDAPSLLEVRSRWIASEAMIKFETGVISKEEFLNQFIDEWKLPFDPEEFSDLFTSWVKGPFPNMNELLFSLRDKYQLACLSNTNELHWDLLLNGCGLASQLDSHYASHLIGKVKPCREIFEYVCVDLQVKPEQVIFFDDGLENIEGALAIGINAYQVHGPASIQKQLSKLGI